MRTEAPGPDPSDTVTLRGDLRQQLLDGSIASLALRYEARRIEVEDYNVIGRIDGVGTSAEPELAAGRGSAWWRDLARLHGPEPEVRADELVSPPPPTD